SGAGAGAAAPAAATTAAEGAGGDGAGGDGGVTTKTRIAAAAPAAPARGRAVAGTALFVVGFSLVFAFYGHAVGSLGQVLRAHNTGLTQILGGVTIVVGLMFAGAFDRFTFAGRVFRPSMRPCAGRSSRSSTASGSASRSSSSRWRSSAS